jgi:hypothetical protein
MGRPGHVVKLPFIYLNQLLNEGEIEMIRQLLTFKGCTVDARLKEFRRVDPFWGMEFIRFDTPQGEALLEDLVESINANTQEGRELLISLW